MTTQLSVTEEPPAPSKEEKPEEEVEHCLLRGEMKAGEFKHNATGRASVVLSQDTEIHLLVVVLFSVYI